MKPFSKAVGIFLSNPQENWRKVLPYLVSYFYEIRRTLAELIGIDTFSKPYHGHNDLLKYINFNNGFFVQCGGFDGFAYDPTYYLEKFKGWTGVIIEPIPKAAQTCKRNRPRSTVYQTALVSHQYESSEIELINCNFMSITPSSEYNSDEWIKKGEVAQNINAEKITVGASTLDDILKQHPNKKINLLVIDVEGSEAEVLNGFSLSLHQPDYLLIEIGTDTLKETIQKIVEPNYIFVNKISYSDYLYKRKSA